MLRKGTKKPVTQVTLTYFNSIEFNLKGLKKILNTFPHLPKLIKQLQLSLFENEDLIRSQFLPDINIVFIWQTIGSWSSFDDLSKLIQNKMKLLMKLQIQGEWLFNYFVDCVVLSRSLDFKLESNFFPPCKTLFMFYS